jgi:hypothetical protein
MIANEGDLSQKEIHGGVDTGSYSDHSHLAARCNFENELSRI